MLRPLLNAAYWSLAENADEKGRRQLDRTLTAPLATPAAANGRPRLGAGENALLGMMKGGR